MVGLKMAEPRRLPASRLSGMKTQQSIPRRAACAETLGETLAAHERGEAGVEAGPRLAVDRQQFAVAPQVLRPAFDVRSRHANGCVVVDRFERAETLLADVARLRGIAGLAQMTLQTD